MRTSGCAACIFPVASIPEKGVIFISIKITSAGEQWCGYYFERYKVDVRSLSFPGLISHSVAPVGGTTDYAVEIFYAAHNHHRYTCFLEADTVLPMMYMPDAIRATIQLMHVSSADVRVRSSYNIAAMSFSPQEIADEISLHVRPFEFTCVPDYRQRIAENWPQSIDDSKARADWNWKPEYDLQKMTVHILEKIVAAKRSLFAKC
jgi:nucleoside-diphosphate-sugar epimerase